LEKLLNEVDNFGELVLINICRRISEFSEDRQHRLDKRRRFISQVLLEESNNISETSLGLKETRGIDLKSAKELEGLVASSNSFRVISDC
jgi:hypothetical protein